MLEDAVGGGEFLEGFGLEQRDHDHILVGGGGIAVTMFAEDEGAETSNEPTVPVPGSVSGDGLDRLECGSSGAHLADEWDGTLQRYGT